MRGTLSGEHGIGVLKAPFLPLEQSADLIDVQRKIKATLQPAACSTLARSFRRPVIASVEPRSNQRAGHCSVGDRGERGRTAQNHAACWVAS